ncbi:GAF domain-containing protein [Mycolicibacterium sp. P9-64]|uniref:GAF domain-containing sensor histidine kinase n=1 Tax=Mycolicibacterium sp. P9-64 TaxID=2024612 RepID=UPI0011EF878A|nr:GAF domain-containing sensor histidine kinase [Mycolicibacterium sp. P9-64]KAA0082609.1 GAF domain-containing protein [Mycolicibacterium sp. P9-64]
MSLTAGAAPTATDLARLFGADGVLVYVVNGQDLNVVDIWPAHPSADALTLQVGFGVTGLVARTGKPALIEADSPRNVLHRQLLGLEEGQTVARMCLPLPGLEGDVVGVLAAHRDPHAPFGEVDLCTAEPYAAILGLRLEAKQLWRTVNNQRTERDRLIKAAISAQEAERRRIAFELHDGVTTALASMSFHLSAADLTISKALAASEDSTLLRQLDCVRAELLNARKLGDLAYNQTRAAITGLHSLVLDDLGLTVAIESLVQMARQHGGPSIEFVVDPAAAVDDIPDHAAAALYRITQEALANAVKHAEADRIVVSLRGVGDSIVLGCADDGRGFDAAERQAARAADAGGAQHFGVSSMAERCAMIEASLRVESAPGRGTTVLVEVPL